VILAQERAQLHPLPHLVCFRADTPGVLAVDDPGGRRALLGPRTSWSTSVSRSPPPGRNRRPLTRRAISSRNRLRCRCGASQRTAPPLNAFRRTG
jgi:hypothetical protein